jgi:hypothetical protein
VRKLVIGAAVAAFILSTTACGSSGSPAPVASPDGGQTPSHATAPTATATGSAAAAPTPSATAILEPPIPNTPSAAGKILGAGTLPDGVAFEICYRVVQASPQAVGAEDGKIVILDLTATNHSSAPIRLGTMGADIAYDLTGAVPSLAEQATDPVAGINDVNVFSFEPLEPGKSLALTNGYGLPRSEMGSVAVEVFGPELGSGPVKVRGSFTSS